MPYKKPISISFEKSVHIVLFLLCFFPLFVSLFLTTDGRFSTFHFFAISRRINNICIFKLITGYRCPVCGMTRCFAFMSHGSIVNAWHASHAGVALYFFCIFECIYRLSRIIFTKIPFLKVFAKIEAVFLIIVGTATVFFFAVQFFYPALAY